MSLLTIPAISTALQTFSRRMQEFANKQRYMSKVYHINMDTGCSVCVIQSGCDSSKRSSKNVHHKVQNQEYYMDHFHHYFLSVNSLKMRQIPKEIPKGSLNVNRICRIVL